MKNKTVVLLIAGALLSFLIAYCLIYAKASKREQAEKRIQVSARFEQLKTEAREGHLMIFKSDGFSPEVAYEIIRVDRDNEKLVLLGARGYPIDEWMVELARREFRLVPLVSTFAEKSAEQK